MSAASGYRFSLTRTWDESLGKVCWVMLNPSTADQVSDDPTIRKCIGFAKRWRYGSIWVVNLWAMRATNPRELRAAVKRYHHGESDFDPSGGAVNDDMISIAVRDARVVVAAWGAHANAIDRDRVALFKHILRSADRRAHCIGTTRDGSPRHPLMVSYLTKLEPWRCP